MGKPSWGAGILETMCFNVTLVPPPPWLPFALVLANSQFVLSHFLLLFAELKLCECDQSLSRLQIDGPEEPPGWQYRARRGLFPCIL